MILIGISLKMQHIRWCQSRCQDEQTSRSRSSLMRMRKISSDSGGSMTLSLNSRPRVGLLKILCLKLLVEVPCQVGTTSRDPSSRHPSSMLRRKNRTTQDSRCQSNARGTATGAPSQSRSTKSAAMFTSFLPRILVASSVSKLSH